MKPTAHPDLTPLLNQEILRVAREEKCTDDTSMKQFMSELADLCGVSLRMIYHYRSGHTKLPGAIVPSLCKRFGSLVLLDALKAAAEQTEIHIPDEYDLARLASRSVREDMQFIAEILVDFESDGIQPHEMERLRELEARAHGNLHRLMGIAEADCERRMAQAEVSRKGSAMSAPARSAVSEPRAVATGLRKLK